MRLKYILLSMMFYLLLVFRWRSNYMALPGLTKSSIELIGRNIKEGDNTYRLCCLHIDEMELKKHIDYERHSGRVYGFVDIGDGPLDDTATQPHASKALCIVAVGLIGHWKLPIGYVFTDGTNANLQSKLITNIVQDLYEKQCVVVSITFDGLAANLKTVELLGGNMSYDNFNSKFPHPSIPNFHISVVLDACHMLKLFRNLLEQEDILLPNCGKAQWLYIDQLQKLQNSEGLVLANKLTDRHVNFKQQKMKVRLAAQVFSSSVAKALEYLRKCDNVLFANSLATETLLLNIDKLFDLLNSKSIFGTGYKKPVTLYNWKCTKKILLNLRKFLLSLCTSTGQLLAKSKKRTCVIGFCSGIDAMLYLMDNILIKNVVNNVPLKYLLTNRMSQDHIETFFSVIRRRGGWNNNPTALQFVYSYRAILCKANPDPSPNANATSVIPLASSSIEHRVESSRNLFDFGNIDEIINSESDVIEVEFDDNNISCILFNSQLPKLSAIVENICEYIAGYIVRKMLPKLKCEECRLLIVAPVDFRSGAFLELKNNGGLIKPVTDIVYIVTTCEKVFRNFILCRSNPIQSLSRMGSLLENIIFESINFNIVFPGIEHFCDTAVGFENHLYSLVRVIIKAYLKLRNYHLVKCYNTSLHSNVVRQKLTKLILFSNQ